jgi:hypothetical protein
MNEKGNLQMSNIVRTWKNEANPAGEIELTDTELAAVYGALDDDGFLFHQDKHSSNTTIKKKVIFFAEDLLIKKNNEDNDFSGSF